MNTSVTDFESRSDVELKVHGLFRYMASPITEPICLANAYNDDDPVIWVNPKFLDLIDPGELQYRIISAEEMQDLVLSSDKMVAHNSMFEYLMWNRILVPRFGWRPISMLMVHDSMAQCATHALPMNLDQATKTLGLVNQKDDVGHKVMLKMCKPRNPLKKEKEADPDWASKLWWHEVPADIITNINYCGKDVLAERDLHCALAPLTEKEREIWLLDQKINLRGIGVDVENVTAIVETIQEQESAQLAHFQELTNGAVSGPRSYVALKNWVNEQLGLKLTSVDKDSSARLLKKDIPDHVRAVLEIKSELSKSSVAKFRSMLNRMNADGRVRGWSAYHAAATGRWAAWGLQLHNNPRDCYDANGYEHVVQLFQAGDIEGLKMIWGSPYYVASRCIRGALVAQEGNQYYCTDYSAVEGRGLAYLAGEQWVLDAYSRGEDMYLHAAADLFGVPYESLTKKDKRRQIGKVEELFLGYNGGIGAFASGAKGYGINLELLPELVLPRATEDELGGMYGARALAKIYVRNNPGVMSEEAAVACDIIKRKWRAARPKICALWSQLEKCAIDAINEPGTVFTYRKLKFVVRGRFLQCYLPSGRCLYYFDPELRFKETEWGTSQSITFMGMKIVDGKTTRQWTRLDTFGGKLAENVTQAFCRDLIAEAMLRHDAAGYPIVLHVHDEDLAEVPIGVGSLKEYNAIAEIVPYWAEGMPIKAEGWIGHRYQK